MKFIIGILMVYISSNGVNAQSCNSDADCPQGGNITCVNGQCECPTSYFLYVNTCIYDCGNPPSLEVDGIPISSTLQYGNALDGDFVYYFCPDGYTMSGISVGICEVGGWTDIQPVCLRDCGNLPAIENGNVTLNDSTNTTVGAIATVSCDEGYTESNRSIKCLDTGQWENANCTKCKPGYTGDKCITCLTGFYGKYCDSHCMENCFSCLSKTNCTECKEGLFGETCTLSCPLGCEGRCAISDGRCLDCKSGFIGEFCNNTCVDGTYGNSCSKLCSGSDRNCRVCFGNEYGNYGGCTQCNMGYYSVSPFGLNHSICKSCPIYCRDHECNTSGLCITGCLPGKWGDRCSNNCLINCLECKQTDGKCLECTNETFSDDCSQKCSTDCNMTDSGRICAGDTGECLHGCLTFTRYGDYCEKHCNDTCNNQSCDWKKGNCLEGCVMNYHGSFCELECAYTCKSNEDKRVCGDVDGHCTFGCKDGFYGGRCEKLCSSQCINTTCSKETGACLHGCIDSFEGVKCLQASTSNQEGQTTGILVGASFGSGLAGIFVGAVLMLAIITLRRRLRKLNQTGAEDGEISATNVEKDNPYEVDASVTYEDLRSRDESVYSQISSNHPITPQATDYVNYSK